MTPKIATGCWFLIRKQMIRYVYVMRTAYCMKYNHIYLNTYIYNFKFLVSLVFGYFGYEIKYVRQFGFCLKKLNFSFRQYDRRFLDIWEFVTVTHYCWIGSLFNYLDSVFKLTWNLNPNLKERPLYIHFNQSLNLN